MLNNSLYAGMIAKLDYLHYCSSSELFYMIISLFQNKSTLNL